MRGINGVAERADGNFVVHVTWAVERTPGMCSHRRLGFTAFGDITEFKPGPGAP